MKNNAIIQWCTLKSCHISRKFHRMFTASIQMIYFCIAIFYIHKIYVYKCIHIHFTSWPA